MIALDGYLDTSDAWHARSFLDSLDVFEDACPRDRDHHDSDRVRPALESRQLLTDRMREDQFL
jgi:hypothetical protein